MENNRKKEKYACCISFFLSGCWGVRRIPGACSLLLGRNVGFSNRSVTPCFHVVTVLLFDDEFFVALNIDSFTWL